MTGRAVETTRLSSVTMKRAIDVTTNVQMAWLRVAGDMRSSGVGVFGVVLGRLVV